MSDLLSSGFNPAELAEQLSRFTPVPIPYRAPPNYAMIATAASSFLTFIVIIRFIQPILQSRWTWALLTVGTSLVMVGGFMFVRIRGMPYVAGGPNGAQLIAPGFQTQYGIEVQIIAFLCASFESFFLTEQVPTEMPKRRCIISWIPLLDPHRASSYFRRASAIRCLCLDRRILRSFLRPSVYLQNKKWR